MCTINVDVSVVRVDFIDDDVAFIYFVCELLLFDMVKIIFYCGGLYNLMFMC